MDFRSRIEEALGQLKNEGLDRHLVREAGISFVHNDYLGLAQHPKLVEAGASALRLFGAGSTGSRLLGGNSALAERVEEKLAAFFGAPAALFFSSGYLANLAAVNALSPFVDEMYSDSLNHASLIDAIRLTGKRKVIVPHGEWAGVSFPEKPVLVVSETLFSMDGDAVDPALLLGAAACPSVFCHLDEAHAAGLFRETGQGWVEKAGVDWDRCSFTVTFGKAFGASGAAILCAPWLKEWLINKGRSFIYSTAPAPAVLATVEAALSVLSEESWRREELWERSRSLRARLSKLPGQPIPPVSGLWESAVPIIPFRVSGEARILRFCESMRESGFALRPIRYPTVAKGQERIRLSLNLGVSQDNTEALAESLEIKWTAFLSQEPIQA